MGFVPNHIEISNDKKHDDNEYYVSHVFVLDNTIFGQKVRSNGLRRV